MTTFQETLKIVLDKIPILDIEQKPPAECLGQVLAEDICSRFDLPTLDSAMPDGYAVRSEDIVNASRTNPVVLRIIDTARAGGISNKEVVPGTAIRIMTGSVVPAGADCVVRFEDTDEPDNKCGPNPGNPTAVKIYISLKSGTNIARAGTSTRRGTRILSCGKVLGIAQLSVITTLGIDSIKVYRRPRVSIISTGDELVSPGQPLSPGKSYDSNSLALTTLVSHVGGLPRFCGIAGDTEDSLQARIQSALPADVIITSGGASKGDFDLVRTMIKKNGQLHMARINIGPGASFSFGEYHCQPATSVPFFVLSGPSSGCLINFETLVRPAILKMLGYTDLKHPIIEAVAEDEIPGKRSMGLAKWTRLQKNNGRYSVVLNHSPEAGPMGTIVNSNSLTLIFEGEEVRTGDIVQVLPLDWTLGESSFSD
jgi:molybdopterin molybdotransferase